MPDINFNDTYDELSNLAVDPAEMKKDDIDIGKAKKFFDLIKETITEKYGDIICSPRQAKALGLIDYTYHDWPIFLDDNDSIPDIMKIVEETLQGLAYSKDIAYKLALYYHPSKKAYSLKLFVDENGKIYRQMSDWMCPADIIEDNEREIKKNEKELSEFEAKKAREKKAIEDIIEKDKKEIQFIKDHTQEDALTNKPNLKYKAITRWV